MPLSDVDDSDLPPDPRFIQLSFPFQVRQVQPSPEPNHYSLAPVEDLYQEGGGFFYEDCPAVFLGRTGYGPLRMAWDTNILVDYAEFGHLMWEADDEFDPPISEPRYREELIALDAILQLWMMRDIRVRAPERQILDAQRELDEAKWEMRARELHHFLAALQCIELDKEVLQDVQPFDALPDGSSSDEWDESLVQEAIETGCHVFLTRDTRLRRRLDRIARESFMVITSPSDLCRVLADAGEVGWGREGYIMPDNHKWIHFISATNAEDEA